MNTRHFSIEELEALGLPYKNVTSWSIEKRRWYDLRAVVFEADGTHWVAHYMDPLTEMQEGQDIWHSDPTDAYEVELVEVTIKRWEVKR